MSPPRTSLEGSALRSGEDPRQTLVQTQRQRGHGTDKPGRLLTAEERASIRNRARAAIALSRALRDPDVVGHRAQAALDNQRVRRKALGVLADALVRSTALADRGQVHPVFRQRVARLSVAVGRDPAIEEAKSLLAERYMISGDEAFALLRQMSQRTNRKLRMVAREVCDMYDDRGS